MSQIVALLTVYQNDRLPAFQSALESLYGQSLSSFDIYVQEDGPVDKEIHDYLTDELACQRITFLGTRDENKGFDYSLNELIDRAMHLKYDYMVRMDADDIAVSDRLERQLSFMESHPEVDVCGTFIEEFGEDINYIKLVKYPLSHQAMLRFFQKRVPIAHVSAFFRCSYFKKAGLYETQGHWNNGDTLMWMKGFAANCQFANIDYIGVKVRVNQDFFSRRGGLKKAWSDFKNRLTVNHTLGFGPLAYGYACSTFVVNLLPSTMKKYAYKYLR